MKQQATRKTSIGGQALIEGVMMRGPEKTAMAVRDPSGEIVLESWETSGKKRSKVFKLPFIRGVFNFIDSMRIGYRSLLRSAELAGFEEESQSRDSADTAVSFSENDTAEHTANDSSDAKKKTTGMFEGFGMTLVLVLSMLLGVAIAVGLFMTLPTFLFNRLREMVPVLQNKVWGNVLRAVMEGLIRILLFVGYIFAVSLMKDIKRVFMYHGAEHKTIFCYEKGEALTVENVRRQTRFHPRCGTSFMILMLVVGIVVSMFISVSNPIIRTGIKLLTIPIIVGIGYELIKLAGRSNHWLVRAISAPGLWLQRITTKEPTDDMIEVAITSFTEVAPPDDSDLL
ncbi:MAG TPA: DUF1385 domain-containing protein [Ruminococcaceae bacterium]|nr:DUF1385 domain-containing protein [Oscillospiraceae bacterium]HCA30447.1 DUF1385 domain-containing protein [Oscillospiraceae bacterium]